MPREWRALPGYDVACGEDADVLPAHDIEACRRHCEGEGFGGFTIFEGEAFFRRDTAESLLQKRETARQANNSYDARVTLHICLTVSTVLRERNAGLAVVGTSLGLWLEASDFVFRIADRNQLGFGKQDARIIGPHGFPRNLAAIWGHSTPFKALMKKKGPLATRHAMTVRCPGGEYDLLLDDLELLPLQSFANAISVEAEVGLPVVQGWAVYDLLDYTCGTAYMAERYWWNKTETGEWLDFTPRPTGSHFEKLLLVESSQHLQRKSSILTQELMYISEVLLQSRTFVQANSPMPPVCTDNSPVQPPDVKSNLHVSDAGGSPPVNQVDETIKAGEAEMGNGIEGDEATEASGADEALEVNETIEGDEATDCFVKDEPASAVEEEQSGLNALVEAVKAESPGAVDAVLAVVKLSKQDVRSSLFDSRICELLCARFSIKLEHSEVHLLALLVMGLQEDHPYYAPTSSISLDAIRMLVELLADENVQVAIDAAFVLAWMCRAGPQVQMAARCARAAESLGYFFKRADVMNAPLDSLDAVRAVWFASAERACESPVPSKQHWEGQRHACYHHLQEAHAADAPRERRAHSWARTLSFAGVMLGLQSSQSQLRSGSEDCPRVIWVVGAADQVEAELAAGGFFQDANWIDRTPTEIILFGDGLRSLDAGCCPQTGEPAIVRTSSYDGLPFMSQLGAAPDFIAALMPPIKEGETPCHEGLQKALAAVPPVPALISTRYAIGEGAGLTLRHRLQGQVLVPPLRCPFSAAAGKPNLQYDDNGWIFMVKDPDVMAKALQLNLAPLPKHLPGSQMEVPKQPAIFWGILDIKYDTSQPVLERVKVLETGDGKSSKFSGDGAAILRNFQEQYRFEEDTDLKMDQILSADKKLTHDFMVLAGYEHLVPQQVCFPRKYEPDLAQRITRGLQLTADDCVILKLCNRSRAAGVIISPVESLDETLREILVPPEDPDVWFQEQLAKSMVLELGLHAGTFAENKRHWWSNESPVFVAERWCKSVPVTNEEHFPGKAFDGTLRVGFALRRSGKETGEARRKKQADFCSRAAISQAVSSLSPPTCSRNGNWTRPPQKECVGCKTKTIHGRPGTRGSGYENCWYCNICWKRWEEDPKGSFVWSTPSSGPSTYIVPRKVERDTDEFKAKAGNAPDAGSLFMDVEETPVTPDELEIDWLGGYWKLPKQAMNSEGALRDRVVSAARTSGTAPVSRTHLFEVYSGLGDSVQHLFGSAEPTAEELSARYHPELAAYLLARLGTSRMNRDIIGARRMVIQAQEKATEMQDGPGKSCVVSFTKRAQGVIEAKMRGPEQWKQIEHLFQTSLSELPTNANALFCIGAAALQGGRSEDAAQIFNRALLLDPDFKAPYVMLGVAYIRMRVWQLAIQFSEACLGRHPESPQCDYHIAVACCQLALHLRAKKGDNAAYDKFQVRALSCMRRARSSPDAKRRAGGRTTGAECRQVESPWLPEDDQMLTAMEAEDPQSVPEAIELPPTIGWPWYQYRM